MISHIKLKLLCVPAEFSRNNTCEFQAKVTKDFTASLVSLI